MNIKKLLSLALLVSFTMVSFRAVADNVSAQVAQEMANGFIKTHFKSSPGTLRAPSKNDIVLAHAEPSNLVPKANAYYIFNIKGGGFVIVSGEDHATPVLAYNDEGRIDVNHMSDPLKEMLSIYKTEIDYLLTHDIKAPKAFNQSFKESTPVVGPLTHSEWGPDSPFNLQCPISPFNGLYSIVGCVAVAQAQYVYYWRYPLSCDTIPSYYGAHLQMTIPALPPTTFEYDKMLNSYGYWDINTFSFVDTEYTEEQAYEVAKLCRYCGQASKMNYSPGSSYSGGLLTGLQLLGYSRKAKMLTLSDYEIEVWEGILREQLDQDKPIMYAGQGTGSPGHAFICDGYTDDNYFHFNMGYYGYNNAWYKVSAFEYINRFNKYRVYDIYQRANIYLDPPLQCVVNTEIDAPSGLLFLGSTFYPQAKHVSLNMTYRNLPFMFSLTDANGSLMSVGESLDIRRIYFEQGSDISLALTLPETLPQGTYNLQLNYRENEGASLTPVATASGQLTVVGKFAKFGAPIGIDDVIGAIDMLLEVTPSDGSVSVGDVTTLIDYLLQL